MGNTFGDIRGHFTRLTGATLRGKEGLSDDPTMVYTLELTPDMPQVADMEKTFAVVSYGGKRKRGTYGREDDLSVKYMLLLVDDKREIYALPLPSRNGVPATLKEILLSDGYTEEFGPHYNVIPNTKLLSDGIDALDFYQSPGVKSKLLEQSEYADEVLRLSRRMVGKEPPSSASREESASRKERWSREERWAYEVYQSNKKAAEEEIRLRESKEEEPSQPKQVIDFV